MVKCTSCDEKIDYLKLYVLEENRYIVYPHDESSLTVDDDGFIEGTEKYRDYECPKCNDVLFSDRGDCVIPEGAIKAFFGVEDKQ